MPQAQISDPHTTYLSAAAAPPRRAVPDSLGLSGNNPESLCRGPGDRHPRWLPRGRGSGLLAGSQQSAPRPGRRPLAGLGLAPSRPAPTQQPGREESRRLEKVRAQLSDGGVSGYLSSGGSGVLSRRALPPYPAPREWAGPSRGGAQPAQPAQGSARPARPTPLSPPSARPAPARPLPPPCSPSAPPLPPGRAAARCAVRGGGAAGSAARPPRRPFPR
nr:transcription initiation factor TFIID subunit 4-like [Camelus dromedarius]